MQINDEAKTIGELILVTNAVVEGQHEPIITSQLANQVLATGHRRKALAVRAQTLWGSVIKTTTWSSALT